MTIVANNNFNMNDEMPVASPEGERGRIKPHIMVFPYPAQGHLLPLLDLTHQLCLHGLTVSIIVTPKNLPYLSPLLSVHPSSVSVVTFPFLHHSLIPPGTENVKYLGFSGIPLIMASLSQLQEPIVNWLSSHPNPPVALISDFFLGWTMNLGIPRFAFFSSGAFLSSIVHLITDKPYLFESNVSVCLSGIPLSPVFKSEHLPSLIPGSPLPPEAALNFSSYGCIFNSCECLEKEYMEHLKQIVTHNRVYGVGPLSSIGLCREDSNTDVNAKTLLSWLDGCPDESVLYICFGSQKVLTKEQCDALALGLDKSKTRFVWVAKKDPIPNGFGDRVAGRGLIIRGIWAPQVAVLSHVAVGGFLSHCGWNSVLEAMASGTLILTWPMEADQFGDATLLVEHMGVAVRISEGGTTVPNSEELGRVISETMGECGREVRARAKEMGQNVRAATESRGSSSLDLQRLVKDLSSL